MVAFSHSSAGPSSWPGGASGGSTRRLRRARLTTPHSPSTPSAARRRHIISRRSYSVVGKVRGLPDQHAAGGVTQGVTGGVTRAKKKRHTGQEKRHAGGDGVTRASWV